jgi:hypothetical protein
LHNLNSKFKKSSNLIDFYKVVFYSKENLGPPQCIWISITSLEVLMMVLSWYKVSTAGGTDDGIILIQGKYSWGYR